MACTFTLYSPKELFAGCGFAPVHDKGLTSHRDPLQFKGMLFFHMQVGVFWLAGKREREERSVTPSFKQLLHNQH